MNAPQPVFEAPWHAEAFAVAVHLESIGVFSWPDWVGVFSSVLAAHGVDRDLDGGDDYFHAWVEALEQILATQGLAPPEDLKRFKTAWETAYLATPHGAPVHLADGV